jgi:hypothetical protein
MKGGSCGLRQIPSYTAVTSNEAHARMQADNEVCRFTSLEIKIFQGNKQRTRTITFVVEALLVP